jgi:large subunit ribosomal protein L6
MGLIKDYFKYIQLRGRGFRYLFFFSQLVVKFGFSHKLYYILPANISVTLITKQVLKIYGKSLQQLKSIFFDLHSIRKFDKYKGKGLLYCRDTLVLKASSKKTSV